MYHIFVKVSIHFLEKVSSKAKTASNLEFTRLLAVFLTGDEGIEPPPKVLETPIIPFDQSPIFKKRHKAFGCTFKTTHKYLISFHLSCSYHLTWLCPRPISNSQLHALLHFHLCPIYLVVFKGSYNLRWDISS